MALVGDKCAERFVVVPRPVVVRPSPLLHLEEKMRRFLLELWREESGQDATEYVLLVVLIALAITAGMTVLATGINGAFSNASSTLNSTTGS